MNELVISAKWHGTMAQAEDGLFGDKGGPVVVMLIEEIARLEQRIAELSKPVADGIENRVQLRQYANLFGMSWAVDVDGEPAKFQGFKGEAEILRLGWIEKLRIAARAGK